MPSATGPRIAPGEIVTAPVYLAPGATFTNPPDASEDAVAFAAGHTISDIVRYAVVCADAEEVRCILDMMEGDHD